jgi:flagellar protein FliO/FliZ
MQAVTFFFAFVVVLALIGIAAWLVRRFAGNRLGANTNRGRMPRLAVIDAAAVDGRRRLVLVRRDNVEHLIMIGGPTDIVVEPNIVRATAGRDQLPQRPTGAEPPPRIAPLPDPAAWADEGQRADIFDHPAAAQMPEPPPRPARPLFAEEARRMPPALSERRDPLAGFALEPIPRPEPRHEPRAEMRPEPRPEPRSEPRAELRPEPMPLRPEPLPLRPEPLPLRTEPLPLRPEPLSLRPEPLPLRPEPLPLRTEPLPLRPEPMPLRPEPMPQRMSPRGEPMMPRPARQSEAPKAPPPLRAPERMVMPPPPPPPPPAPPPTPQPSADQNLAEMAQRLEAALRRPAAEAVAPEPPPGRAALRVEPAAAAPPVATPSPKSSFENLEDEMASLLGRPKSQSS